MKRYQLFYRTRRSVTGALIFAIPGVLLCGGVAVAAPFAAPAVEPVAGAASGLVRVTVALIIVLAAVLAAAWFARRVRGFTAESGPNLQVLAQLSLGARERAVLLRVGEREVLVGVAPGSVQTLYVLERHEMAPEPGSPIASTTAPQRPTFKSMLLKSLGK